MGEATGRHECSGLALSRVSWRQERVLFGYTINPVAAHVPSGRPHALALNSHQQPCYPFGLANERPSIRQAVKLSF